MKCKNEQIETAGETSGKVNPQVWKLKDEEKVAAAQKLQSSSS
jgi:hypothetical protein